MRKSGILTLVALVIAGCGGPPNPPGPASLPKMTPQNSTLRKDDPELDAAIAKARATLDSFIARLEHPKPREVFSIEAQFAAPDGTHEYLWLDDVTFKDDLFKGTLRNRPAKVVSLRQGTEVSAKKSDVTDWTIFTSGKGEGGYTVDVLLRREGQAP